MISVGQRPALGLQRRFLGAVVLQDVGRDSDGITRWRAAVGCGWFGRVAGTFALGPRMPA